MTKQIKQAFEGLFPLGDPEKHSVWDNVVPIIQEPRAMEVYISSGIGYPDEYNELCYMLEHAYEGDIVTMHLNTPGGSIDSAFKIVAAMKKCKAHIVGVLSGTVASAGTVITMFCDEIIVEDYTQFLIHNYSTGSQGKGGELVAYITFNDRELRAAFSDIYKGFITKGEVDKIVADQDLWLNKSEILARWAKKEGTDVPVKGS